ncbi:MAG: hypothetical protein PHQ53_12245 [Candidatus Krumholzibacteria bacterium]|nr:hypothetical protein [Candidatus Krumholzibacteria bacterium]
MTAVHTQLAAGRWAELSFAEQMGHIGSEISRTIGWLNKGNQKQSERAFFRALELLDLTIAMSRGPRLLELCRTREALADHFYFDNEYQSTSETWQRYFDQFALLARRRAGAA